MNKLYNGDCLEVMKSIPDKSIDLILCDLPYGITSCKWDNIIPFDKMWDEYNRICKGYILLFASGLFTVDLINSNRNFYKYKWIWSKNVPTGMGFAKYRPMNYFEEILVFESKSQELKTYNPILKPREGIGKGCYKYDHYCNPNNHINMAKQPKRYNPDFVQPSNIISFNVVPNRKGKLHPTQKPVELLEYLIKTYSNEGETVLDNCMGSGSTGVACKNTNRNFIGIELDKTYYEIAKERIEGEVRLT